MQLETAFRLSFYVTLGFACACLAQAEALFLAWFAVTSLALLGVVFALAWQHEGRWVISETASNYLGIFIGLAAGGWILMQVPRSEAELIAGGVPWPAGLLPHLGLLLLMLLAVKLFRPKQLSDFWVIQTIGVMIVTLGCVLAGDPLFAGLLVAYLASLVWCLALFQLYRARRPAAGPLFTPVGQPRLEAAMPWRHLGLAKAGRWSLAVLGIGLPLFMLLPRSSDSQWVPKKLSSTAAVALTVGVESGINLNRVGTIELSPKPAFHVTVADAAGNPARLDGEQLWCVSRLDYYHNGHWMDWVQVFEFARPTPTSKHQPITPTVPPPHAGQRFLRYTVRPAMAGGLVLAEPLDLRHIGIDATMGEVRPGLELFHAIPGGDSVHGHVAKPRLVYTYTQVITPVHAVEWLPAHHFAPEYRDYLLAPKVPADIVAWIRPKLEELTSLTPAQRQLDEQGRLPPEHHAAVSQALCRYLANSGDYRYTLNLKRQTPAMDPTADFLINVKAGHCERFAGALALALRGLGIPARVVKGYRGAEEEEAGKYVVRLDQAHSWVQVLVRDGDAWFWMTLDPTPRQGDAPNPLTTWFAWLSDLDPDQLWRRFVLNYNGEAQASTLHYLWQGLWQSSTGRHLLWLTPTGMVTLALLAVAWRRRGRLGQVFRLPRSWPSAPSFYGQLLRVLDRRMELRPMAGQTPLEFAAVAGTALAQHPATERWADLPAQAAHVVYRIRFADEQLSTAEDAALRQRIAALAVALAAR